jgi:hypothetical protein
VAYDPAHIPDCNVHAMVGKHFLFHEPIPYAKNGHGYLRVTKSSLWWQQREFPGVWTSEGLKSCVEKEYKWSINSITWNHIQAMWQGPPCGNAFPSCYKCSREIGPDNWIQLSGPISRESSYPARFPGCICSTTEKRSHKNHVGRGFETSGRIGSAWTSHRLHHAHMVNVARASEARDTRARAREPERRTASAKPGP